jgi:hypothetical protein
VLLVGFKAVAEMGRVALLGVLLLFGSLAEASICVAGLAAAVAAAAAAGLDL